MFTAALAQTINQVERLAEEGNLQAQYVLGTHYLNGKDVMQNDALALEWLSKSAEAGYADAQFFLSVLYIRGKGVARDNDISFAWIKKAADQEHL